MFYNSFLQGLPSIYRKNHIGLLYYKIHEHQLASWKSLCCWRNNDQTVLQCQAPILSPDSFIEAHFPDVPRIWLSFPTSPSQLEPLKLKKLLLLPDLENSRWKMKLAPTTILKNSNTTVCVVWSRVSQSLGFCCSILRVFLFFLWKRTVPRYHSF